MKFGYLFILFAMAALAATLTTGCNPESSRTAEHSDHDHDHLPAHGPNNGHLFRLDGSDMVGEWMHYSNNDIIRVVLLDAALKEAISYDAVTITPKAGDDKTPYVLELDPDKNPEGTKTVYMLDEKRLMLAMSLGVEVEFKIGDKSYKGEIAPHAPHDH